jgi:anti-sigma factor RsiW
MNHEHWTDRLSDYADDELRVEDREAVDRHLAECEECRQVLAEIVAVSSRAASLTDVPPESDLWPRIAADIGAASQNASNVVPIRLPRRFSFTVPQLVAASLALMVLSGGMVWMARLGGDRTDFPALGGAEIVVAPGVTSMPAATSAPAASPMPASFAEAHYDEAIADLQQTLEAGRSRLDPETIRVLENNLAAIDRAIEQCRKALSLDPANGYLADHLVSAKKRKLALLRRATAMAEGAS